MAYIFNAGDFDFHKYNDLSKRLLTRDPGDAGVTLAMVREGAPRAHSDEFEGFMLQSLERIRGEGKLGGTDWVYYAQAYLRRGSREDSKADYERGLAAYRRARTELLTQSRFRGFGCSPWLQEAIWHTERQLKSGHLGVDPNLPKGEKSDDSDPQFF